MVASFAMERWYMDTGRSWCHMTGPGRRSARCRPGPGGNPQGSGGWFTPREGSAPPPAGGGEETPAREHEQRAGGEGHVRAGGGRRDHRGARARGRESARGRGGRRGAEDPAVGGRRGHGGGRARCGGGG